MLLFAGSVSMAQEVPSDLFELKKLGQLDTRTTQEIASSDLWVGGEVLDRDYADYHAYKHYLDSLGAKKIRLQSGWAKTEKQKGVYDFAWMDSVVDDAISRGVQPWVQISYGNEIYPSSGGISLGEGLPTSDEGLQAFVNYTGALVAHFKGRVNEWEIWNEADHRYNDAGPEQYAKLYYQTAKKVKEVQPNAKLIGLSIAGVGNTEYADFFFNFLKERDALHLVDVVTFHGYPRNPDQGFDSVEKLQATVYKYRPGMPMWQGETGSPSSFGSSGALSGHPWTELTQAKWDLRRALAHVGRGYPFSLFTISEFTYDRQKFSGLNSKGILKVNEDLSIAYAKPAYYAYQNLTALLDHRMERLTGLPYEVKSDSSLAVFAYRHKTSQAPLVFTWINGSIPSDSNKTTQVDVQLSGLTFTDPVLVDLRTGAVYDLPDDGWQQQGKFVSFSKIPVYDSPVAIAEASLMQIKK
jgi:hypothetical protein